jgi:altronate hydrolase
MLYEIESQAAAHNPTILLHPDDTVAIARKNIEAGRDLEIHGVMVRTLAPIPAGHKVAIRSIRAGDPVYRYGNVIGFATTAIQPGEHVHVHNLGYQELDTAEIAVAEKPSSRRVASSETFLGYRRADGRVGTRNYIAVVAASNCAAHTAELIAESFAGAALPENLDGIVAFPHGEGCGQAMGPDTEQLQRTLEGVLDHPNVSAALILGLGCEVNQIDHYLGRNGSDPGPAALHGLTLQTSGGTRGTVEAARKQIFEFIDRAAAEKRTETPASKLVLG